MAMDMDEARGIVEDAKRRGVIRSPGAVPVRPGLEKKEINTVLPDWLQESILNPPPHD